MNAARGFPAFGRIPRKLGPIAATAWGKAWNATLEELDLDEKPLKDGRKLAHTGVLGPITLSPGRVRAEIGDSGELLSTLIQLPTFTDRTWKLVLDQIATRAGHVAALLDGELPEELLGELADEGLPLIPLAAELEPECDCDMGFEVLCKHGAALGYQVSWLLDTEPFLLVLLRGMDQQELTRRLSSRKITAPRAKPTGGTSIAAAYAREPGPLPEISAEPPTGPYPQVDIEPPPGLPPHLVPRMVRNAMWHAREQLADLVNPDPAPWLSMYEDNVRLSVIYPELIADHLGTHATAAAWRYGGLAGLAVEKGKRTLTPLELARARAALEAAELGEFEFDKGCRFTLTGQRWQLRLGEDGLWYPFYDMLAEHGWLMAGPPHSDPAVAFDVPPPEKPKRRRRKRMPDC
ncbi:hypothetical protein [Allokutzneria sp. NRRL B-24872]|uniref:SWIM zinc finger family protein n=1 Tax=Allokutzneria sp. NRRL B-24872 TaxID=1137961 RepID=UPI000A392BD2|nr:hypothetical protein [Allokutzneria sp. NRRL B-24872]